MSTLHLGQLLLQPYHSVHQLIDLVLCVHRGVHHQFLRPLQVLQVPGTCVALSNELVPLLLVLRLVVEPLLLFYTKTVKLLGDSAEFFL